MLYYLIMSLETDKNIENNDKTKKGKENKNICKNIIEMCNFKSEKIQWEHWEIIGVIKKYCSENKVTFWRDGKVWVYDLKTKKILIPCIYTKIREIDGYFHTENKSFRQKDPLHGVIDMKGKEIIPCWSIIYNEIWFRIQTDKNCKKRNIFSQKWEKILPDDNYDSIEQDNKYIITQKNNLFELFDKKGDKLLEGEKEIEIFLQR